MQNLWLIPALPFAGFLINGTIGRKLPKFAVAFIAIFTVMFSFAGTLRIFTATQSFSTPVTEHYFTWIQSGQFRVGWDFTADRLTAVMLFVVTGIGTLIHIYSRGYMDHDESFARFFA